MEIWPRLATAESTECGRSMLVTKRAEKASATDIWNQSGLMRSLKCVWAAWNFGGIEMLIVAV